MESVAARTPDPIPDFVEVFFFVDARDHRSAEFVVGTAFHDEARAFSESIDGDMGIPGSNRVFFRGVLDVHRPEINEIRLHEEPYFFGEGAVCIEFYEEAERFYFPDKFLEIGLERRLAAGDADAVEFPLPLLEKFEEFASFVAACLREILIGRLDEFRIVAERTPEGAADRKGDGSDFPGVVEERERMVSGETHILDMTSYL